MSSKAERLVNLTVSLLEARRPLTLEELKRRTGAYRQPDRESARRMFERDKDELRRLGVPVETRRLSPSGSDFGYIVEREAYELPDVDLDREEVAALAVAVQATDAGTGRLTVTRLAARAPDPGDLRAPPAHVTVDADPVEELADPLLAHQPVSFDYRTATGRASRRTVDPYAVVARRGAWYLVARDHDRDGLRAFRIDRMTSAVRPAGEPGAFTVPDDLDPRAAVSGPDPTTVDATVAVDEDLRWEAERRGGVRTDAGEGPDPVYRFEGVDRRPLESWLRSAGARAEVLTPAELRRSVIEHWRALVDGAS